MIKRILLVENNQFLAEILETNLQVYLNAEIVRRNTIKEALPILSQKDKLPALIICKDEIGDINVPMMLDKCMDKADLSIPMIIMGENVAKVKSAIVIDDPTDLKNIISHSAKYLGVTAKSMSQLTVSAKYPVHLKLFVPSFVCSCDVFFQLDGKYEKVFSKGEKIEKKVLDDLVKADVQNLFVDAMDRLSIVNEVTDFLFNMLNDDNLNEQERINVTAKSFELVQDSINTVGIDPHTAKLAEASIDSMKKILEAFPDLKSLMDKFGDEDQSFRYKHCILNTFIGFKIITQTRWGNKEQQDKFAFVAFFHDITLTNDDHAKVTTQEELEALELSAEEALQVENHALKAAKVVSRYKKLPFGVDTIIKQHHGSRDGKGFNNLSANISPLAIMFIFAEEWTILALEAQENGLRFDKKKVMQYLRNKYNIPKFNQFLPLLEKLNI